MVEVVDWEVDVGLAEMFVAFGLTLPAVRRYAAAVDRAAAVGLDRASRAAILQRLALVKHNRGGRVAAMPHLDEALALVADDPDPDATRVCAGVHATRGLVLRDLGDLPAAQQEQELAAALYAGVGDAAGQARALVDLAVVFKDTDRISQARTVARQALALARSAGADDVAGHAMTTLGLVYELLENWRLALRSQQVAVRLLAGCEEYGAAAVAAHNAAVVQLNQGQLESAERLYEQARVLNQRAGWPIGEANDLSGLASVAKARGDHERARAMHEEALETLVECGDVRGAVQSLVDLAELAPDDGTALAHLHRADAMAADAGELRLVDFVNVAIGDLHRRKGEVTAAESAYVRAVQAAEAPRAWLFDETDAIAYFRDGRLVAHEQLARLALDHRSSSVAFERVERARAGEMVRRLSRLRPPAADRVPGDLVQAESVALEEMQHTAAALQGGDAANPETARRYARAEARWRDVLDTIAHHDEQYAALRRGDRSTAAQIRAALGTHDPDALLIVLHGTESAIHLLGVTARDEHPWHETVSCDTTALIEVIERVITACDRNQRDLDVVAAGLADPRLAAMLGPIVGRSRRGQQICLVPHGALHRLPFAAVQVAGQLFGARNPLVVAPSASVLRYCLAGRRDAVADALVVTNPRAGRPLLYGRAQARAIARHFPTDVLSGARASRTGTLSRLATGQPTPRLLHFTAHGRFVAERPMTSGIRLTDGELTAHDLLGVRLPGSLVVLSACSTGVSGAHGGDEQLGLVRALLYAGAPAVLVGLWEVDELATSLLFDSFYRELAGGACSAEALRVAQTELRACTAAQAVEYVRDAREGTDAGPLLVEEARMRWLGGEFSSAVEVCNRALADPRLTAAQREAASELRAQARFAGTAGDRPTPHRPVYANPYFWAPFVLVGDWRLAWGDGLDRDHAGDRHRRLPDGTTARGRGRRGPPGAGR